MGAKKDDGFVRVTDKNGTFFANWIAKKVEMEARNLLSAVNEAGCFYNLNK